MKYIFGPILSRRLGLSLGVDLLPYKTCSLNCAYCECGYTNNLTSEICEYVPTDDVIAEISDYLTNHNQPDYLTFSGSGEPTLHSGIGLIIDYVKDNFPNQRVAVLTNSTLLMNADVRKRLLRADLVMPSLDAASETVFNELLKPDDGITADSVINGIIEFRKEYSHYLAVEVFIAPGINDSPEELDGIKKALIKINPDAVQLNSLERPAPSRKIIPADTDHLQRISDYMKPLPVQIIYRQKKFLEIDSIREIEERIISSLKRRDHSIEDLSIVIGINKNDLLDIMNDLLQNNRISFVINDGNKFYKYLL